MAFVLLWIGVLTLGWMPTLWGHPISMSSAIVEVREGEVVVDLEILLEDLVLYHSLSANGEMKYSSKDLLAAAEKHRKFVLEYFSILDANGMRLVGTIQKETLDQIAEDGVHQSDLMRRVIGYQLRYETTDAQPGFLTFLQNFGGKNSVFPAVMDLIVWHRDRLEDAVQLAFSRPQTFKLDWERKYEGNRPSFAEIRKKRKEAFQASLGISSYTGLYSFLYVNRFEVRHEILIPLLTLEQWVEIPRRDPNFLEIEEQSALKDTIETFFKKHCMATVNDQQVEGKLSRLNFFALDIADFALNAEPRRVSVHQARVGVIWTFPSRETPKTVSVNWSAYSEFAQFLNSVVLIGNETPIWHYFHANEQTYQWTGNLQGAKTEAVQVGSAQWDTQEQTQVFTKLLTNIYRAFDFREDEDVYDALSTSVQGELLREVYLRVKRSLLMAEQGGSLAHATDVKVVTVAASPKSKDEFDVVWQVTSVSEHWGHIHTQTAEFKARMGLSKKSGIWRFETFQLLDEKKIKFETSIRGNDSSP